MKKSHLKILINSIHILHPGRIYPFFVGFSNTKEMQPHVHVRKRNPFTAHEKKHNT